MEPQSAGDVLLNEIHINGHGLANISATLDS